MARSLPDGWETLAAAGVAPFEVATLRRLVGELPDHLLVFHGVHWTRLEHGCSAYGEVDFVVLGATGSVVIIEQKSGVLEETADGLFKQYRDKRKSVARQMQRSIDALQSRYKKGHGGRPLALDYLLYCPDHRVVSPATAGIAPERIIDARTAGQLPEKIVAMLSAQPAVPGNDAGAVEAFLTDVLELAPDPGALVGHVRNLVTRVSGGLATWARRLDYAPFRLRVDGTAGSGKTQLALRVLADADARGQRAMYVCFNRPLADHVRRLASPEVAVTTFHMLSDRKARERGEVPDFGRTDVFDHLAEVFASTPPRPNEQVDLLVIDEGQDFAQGWADALLRYVAQEGQAWWLEDPMQNLYDRPRVVLPGWVTLHAHANYRTPRDVLRDIDRLVGAHRPVEAACPIEGEPLDIATYGDLYGLRDATTAAIAKARLAGFALADIVVLTYCGRERSALLPFDRLGKHAMRRFDGTYDGDGNPVFRAGDVLIETVFRFKGQSAPCVILTEIDFDEFDERVARRLYVGATRATMRVSLVVSERAVRKLLQRME